METRAAVAHAAGQPLTIETVTLDGPRAGEVLVEIKATGVCHTDEFTLSGADPEGIFPAILGHEGAGVVVGLVEQTHLGGDRVDDVDRDLHRLRCHPQIPRCRVEVVHVVQNLGPPQCVGRCLA